MLFPSIETGTAMNARESEDYLPISRSFYNMGRRPNYGRNSNILIPDPYR
jgi:hypothetical protein